MHSTAQYSVQRKSIPDWQLWILAVVILIGCWYSDRSIKCACSWPTSRQWMESKEPEALTTIQPSNIKRPAMSNAFPCITATEPTNQWNGLQRCLLSKWIRKRFAHSCMCGTAAEIRGTFFSCWDQLIPQHISRLWDFEEVISEAHGRAAWLHFSTYGKTTSCDPRQISCNTGMLKY